MLQVPADSLLLLVLPATFVKQLRTHIHTLAGDKQQANKQSQH
jgi:hypothetical protein